MNCSTMIGTLLRVILTVTLLGLCLGLGYSLPVSIVYISFWGLSVGITLISSLIVIGAYCIQGDKLFRDMVNKGTKPEFFACYLNIFITFINLMIATKYNYSTMTALALGSLVFIPISIWVNINLSRFVPDTKQ